jgi:hypothetical protein
MKEVKWLLPSIIVLERKKLRYYSINGFMNLQRKRDSTEFEGNEMKQTFWWWLISYFSHICHHWYHILLEDSITEEEFLYIDFYKDNIYIQVGCSGSQYK